MSLVFSDWQKKQEENVNIFKTSLKVIWKMQKY